MMRTKATLLTLLVLSSVLMTSLHSSSIESFLKTMKETQDRYKNDANFSKTQKENLIETLNIPDEDNVTQKHAEIIKHMEDQSHKKLKEALPWITQNMIEDNNDEDIKKALDAITKNMLQSEKSMTIFYLFSTSQSEYGLYNFVKAAQKLETIEPNVKYYGVVRGMLGKDELSTLYKPFKYDSALEGKAIIKMNPFIFRDLELTKVPAIVISECASGEFRYKSCENKYLVRGDISLMQAFEIVSKENNEYERYYDLLYYEEDKK